MFLTSRLEKALSVALTIHADQKRKDSVTPYAVHPISVAMLLSRYIDDEDVIIAGLLHDALEDTSYKPEEIERVFGKRVLSIVKECTESAPKTVSWEKRKLDYLMSVKSKSRDACLVVCADKIHNLKSISYAYAVLGEELWKRFNATKEKKLWFYEQIYKEMKGKFRHPLILELHHAIKEIKGVKVYEAKPKERMIGPYKLVKWEHFLLHTGLDELYVKAEYGDFAEAVKAAIKLTRKAREKTIGANSKAKVSDLNELWHLSCSYGVYDSVGRMAFWAAWGNV